MIQLFRSKHMHISHNVQIPGYYIWLLVNSQFVIYVSHCKHFTDLPIELFIDLMCFMSYFAFNKFGTGQLAICKFLLF